MRIKETSREYIVTYIYMGVCVMRDKKLKLRDLSTSHTLGCAADGTPNHTDSQTRLRGERVESGMGECAIYRSDRFTVNI